MAGVTRFDKPIDAQFINTYVPIPFEQMMQAGAMKQQRYDQGTAAMDETVARAEMLRAVPGSIDATKRDKALQELHDLTNKFVGKDMSNSMIIRQFNKEARSIINPAEAREWEDTFVGWQNYKKNEAAMTARGQQIYKPFDFTDYDSSVVGAFSGLPIMDLGANVEPAIAAYLSKPRIVSTEEEEASGRFSFHQRRTLTSIEDHIEAGGKEFDSLVNNPAIQQFMERNEMDVNDLRGYLKSVAPGHVIDKITGAAWPPGISREPSGPIPGDFYSEIKGKGEVFNVDKGKKIVRENRQLHEELDEKQKTLLRLQDKGGDPAKIEALENDIALFEENLGVHDFKLQEARKRADFQHEDAVTAIHDDALEQLTDLGVGQKEAEVLLKKASKYFDQSSPRSKIVQDPELNFKDPETGDYKGIKDDKGHIEYIGFDKVSALVQYVKDNKKQVKDTEKLFENAVEEEFSRTETVNEISLHQTAVQNGIRRFVGGDNKMIPSLIDPAVTTQIQDFPETFEMSADREKLNKTNKLRKYIKNSATDESLYSFELKTIDKLINEDGSLNLNYKLKGPDVGGDSNETMINVKIDEPTQINNIIKQLYLQSGEQGITELVGAMEFKSQMGAGVAAGEYNMVSGISVTVKQEEGVLKVYLPNSNEPVAVANSRRDLPNVLAELNVNILRRIATEE